MWAEVRSSVGNKAPVDICGENSKSFSINSDSNISIEK